MSSPWITMCIWKQKHTSSESVYPQSLRLICLHHGTAPCHCLLFWCLSAQDPLVHTGMEGLDTVCSSGVKLWTSLCRPYLTLAKTWCHKRALLPGLQCGHGADMLGPLQDGELAKCLYAEGVSWICCWGGFCDGTWSWLRKQLVCPTVRWTVDGAWVSQRRWRIGTGGQSPQSQTSLCEVTSSDLSTQVCKRDNWGIFESVCNQTDLTETWKTQWPSRLCGFLT